MKLITNTSLQSWSLPFRTEKGVQSFFLEPKRSVKIPDSYITDDVLRYQRRKLISIRSI